MTTYPTSTVHNGDIRDASFSDTSGNESSAADNMIKRHTQPSQQRQHQVVYTILVWPDFHLRMVRSSTSSLLASWISVRGIRLLISWISGAVGFSQFSPLTSV
ncbi:hypothetical protein [Rosenbergiella epipactidis]|uniref:hypothetical protein n=1 Tax=Rosenbergiella epipactidis TaxID=1544694 RepID=UPI001F4EB6EF|nr:hypothetical protein [Rosenbergiella epipactidis]